jgi:hypothetical protein
MHRRMEDRIRQLCEQAVTEEDPAKLRRTLVDLRDAIHQHVGHLRTRLGGYPVASERRDRKPDNNPKNS